MADPGLAGVQQRHGYHRPMVNLLNLRAGHNLGPLPPLRNNDHDFAAGRGYIAAHPLHQSIGV